MICSEPDLCCHSASQVGRTGSWPCCLLQLWLGKCAGDKVWAPPPRWSPRLEHHHSNDRLDKDEELDLLQANRIECQSFDMFSWWTHQNIIISCGWPLSLIGYRKCMCWYNQVANYWHCVRSKLTNLFLLCVNWANKNGNNWFCWLWALIINCFKIFI